MELFDSSPILVLYDRNLATLKHNEELKQILHSSDAKQLNPIDVVLESLINVVSEKLSNETLTRSRKTVLVSKETYDLAIKEMLDILQKDPTTLRELHRNWLEKLTSFISALKTKGVSRVEDVIFQISMKFRISATSSMKSISSLAK